jgi:flagellar basal-body rod protein FlgC
MTMGLTSIYRISGSALNAQSRNLALIANNMANAQTISGSEQNVYRAQRPVFSEIVGDLTNPGGGVALLRNSTSMTPVQRQLMPEHPLANEDGFIFTSNVNLVEEMMGMMDASRNYQANVEVMNSAKDLLTRTLSLGN